MDALPVIVSTVTFISGAATVLFLFTSVSRRENFLHGARVDTSVPESPLTARENR
ncbi:hypothetical protein [Microbacterium sp.]|uniref:hypothetical protein n=1 Tax=Microbacterium sp. TaxID=51671 RepID=UPI0028110281|nr:hypothetical protein [Microbacterium sp.]